MKLNKNYITLSLMISSIVLLILLQVLWLRSSYEKAHADLKRESGIIFRTTIHDMRDSILTRNIEPLSDSALMGSSSFHMRKDSLTFSIARVEKTRSRTASGDTSSSVRIFITGPPDTLKSSTIRPLAGKLESLTRTKGDAKSFIIRINEDTLSTDSVRQHVRTALLKNKIDLPFSVLLEKNHNAIGEQFMPFVKRRFFAGVRKRDHQENLFSDEFKSEAVPYTPVLQYTASFTGVRSFILKKITPEILFSLFLSLITTGAFALVYGNMRKQQRLLEAKDDFISNVTHELKTPVATVSVALEALKNFSALNNPTLTKEYLDIAQRELTRLSSITDRILKTSVLEQNAVQIGKDIFDLSSTAEEVFSSMKLLGQAANADMTFKSEGKSFNIPGSREHVANALYNLLDNSIKYGGDHPVINVSVIEADSEIKVIVKDNGIGIEEAYHSKIFEKFFRVPSGNVHNIKGYGLGLNYVQTVVALHGGKTIVRSEKGRGSEFILTFPKHNVA